MGGNVTGTKLISGKVRSTKVVICPDCGKERIVRCDINSVRCNSCSAKLNKLGTKRGKNNPSWKGGRRINRDGYVLLTIQPDNSYAVMARGNGSDTNSLCVLEHRLVVAKNLGRPLKSTEVVHHINGTKDDNRLENLELLSSRKDHLPYIKLEQRIIELENRVTVLEAENELLRSSRDWE